MTPRRLLRVAAAWIDDYRYIVGVQVRAWLRPEPPAAFLDGDRTAVLLLPGIYEPWHSLERVARDLNDRGHPVVVVPELGRNLRALRASARVVARRLRATGSRDLVVVAHSKGGLVGKALMLGPLGPRVRGMVTVSTPFGGSRHARWFPDLAVRGLSDRDPHVVSLARQVAVNTRIVTIHAAFDPHVPGRPTLPGAHQVVVDVVGHFRLLEHPQVRRTVLDQVAALSA